jgi:pimeloyl-ACP methyl ester carboxylesterase
MERIKAAGVALLLLFGAVAAAPALAVLARSPRGRVEGLFGIAAIALLACGAVWLAAPLGERPDAAGLSALGILPLILLRWTARRDPLLPPGQIGSHLMRTGTPLPAAHWADVEEDYVRLAIQLITRADPFMPRAEARAARARIDSLLSEVAKLPDYRGIARVAGRIPWRLLRGSLDHDHCYSYRPVLRATNERLGLLVFLHGHGSNYLFVVHALQLLCDRLRLALVAPTFGYGNWEATGGGEVVARATRFGLAASGADPARVFLGGISQGGAGVSRAAAAYPDLFAGLIFISPTMEPKVIDSPAFLTGWKDRQVLVIQGERDRNVHPRTVDRAIELMFAGGVRVEQHRDPDGGHFLFFARLDELIDLIVAWVEGIPRSGR